jgi:hypothetical protein
MTTNTPARDFVTVPREPTDEMLRDAIAEAVRESLGEAYDCTRVWSAWSVGTMGPDDFALVAEDDARVAEIVDAVMAKLPPPAEGSAAPAPEADAVERVARVVDCAALLPDLPSPDAPGGNFTRETVAFFALACARVIQSRLPAALSARRPTADDVFGPCKTCGMPVGYCDCDLDLTERASPEIAALAAAPVAQQEPLTYSSTQATACAGCGKHQHTPLRVDAMGGYVCLTCIDEKLDALLEPERQAEPVGEFVERFSCSHSCVVMFDSDLPTGTKLYATPTAQPPEPVGQEGGATPAEAAARAMAKACKRMDRYTVAADGWSVHYERFAAPNAGKAVTDAAKAARYEWLRSKMCAQMAEAGMDCAHGDFLEMPTIPWGAVGYSVISLCDVLEHMPFPRAALLHAKRMLEDNGVLLVSCPNMDCTSAQFLTSAGSNPYWGEIEHYHNFGRARLYALLRECGFEPVNYAVSERYRLGMEVIARVA